MKTILLVDDEEDILISLSSILKKSNYDVIPAAEGKEVLPLARRFKPDIIILDLMLPDMDGTEVAFGLEKDFTTKDIPIIFLTGMLTKEEEMPLKKTGRRHYAVAKPVTAKELLKVIDSALEEKKE